MSPPSPCPAPASLQQLLDGTLSQSQQAERPVGGAPNAVFIHGWFQAKI